MKQTLISTLLLCLLSACSKDGTMPAVNPMASNYIQPLAVGNSWTYSDTSYNLSAVANFTGYSKDTIVGNYVINGNTYFTVMPLPYDSTFPNLFYLRNINSDTLERKYQLNYKSTFITKGSISGTFIDSSSVSYGGSITQYTTVIYSSLTSINGQSCFSIETTIFRNYLIYSKSIEYIKAGIGMIERVSFRPPSDSRGNVTGGIQMVSKSVLVSYTLK